MRLKSFKRNVWLFNKGNYSLLRDKSSEYDWDSLKNNNIDIYTDNIITVLLSISKSCIPNRDVVIRNDEPPWMTSTIRKSIRKRKRLYRKAKRTGNQLHWTSFRQLRNKTVSLIKEAKGSQTSKLENNLQHIKT